MYIVSCVITAYVLFSERACDGPTIIYIRSSFFFAAFQPIRPMSPTAVMYLRLTFDKLVNSGPCSLALAEYSRAARTG